jgi:hypothetical protein
MNARGVGSASLVLHVGAGVVLLAVTARTAPAWAVLALGCWWLVLTAVAVATFRRTPALTPTVPLIAVAMWTGVMTIGHRLLAWVG